MTTKRKKKAPQRVASKAIARRPAAMKKPQTALSATALTPTVGPIPAALDENIALGDFGLVEIAVTPAEEAVLSEPPPVADLRVKPTGQVYLPHVGYTRWLNRAFGRTGWALKPASRPLLNNNTVVIPYLLMVHGKAVAFALGEQEYFQSNRDQSYGDALESTVASGLRRCCKHLGMGLELWDRSFNDGFLADRCLRVACEVKRDGKVEKKYLWRLKAERPFWNEIQRGRARHEDHDEDRTPPSEVPPAAHYGDAEQPITEYQLRRFWTIARRRGRSEDEIKAYLANMGYASSKAIKRRDYETICQAIEHPNALVVPVPGRDPGQEG